MTALIGLLIIAAVFAIIGGAWWWIASKRDGQEVDNFPERDDRP